MLSPAQAALLGTFTVPGAVIVTWHEEAAPELSPAADPYIPDPLPRGGAPERQQRCDIAAGMCEGEGRGKNSLWGGTSTRAEFAVRTQGKIRNPFGMFVP